MPTLGYFDHGGGSGKWWQNCMIDRKYHQRCVVEKTSLSLAIIYNGNEKSISDTQAQVNNVMLSGNKKQYKADIFKAIKGQICTAVKYYIWS